LPDLATLERLSNEGPIDEHLVEPDVQGEFDYGSGVPIAAAATGCGTRHK
jgi:hypothetical protein